MTRIRRILFVLVVDLREYEGLLVESEGFGSQTYVGCVKMKGERQYFGGLRSREKSVRFDACFDVHIM